MALNVNRAVADPFYRYKMPKLSAKVEGKGNGIKTVISNMSEIAKALERPPMYPTKYFGCELGAQTNFDAKNERYIVNGEHDANKLQDILDGFIKKFVLCKSCENPETQLFVRKNNIKSKCKACGCSFDIDLKHKLSTFIMKNPPKIDVDFSKAEQKNGKKTSGADAAAAVAADIIHNSDKGSSNDDDDDDWEPEPVEPNGMLSAGMGKLVLDKDLEKSEEQRLDMLHTFFLKAKEEDRISDAKGQTALRDEAERLELKQKASLLLANVFLDEKVITDKQISKHRNLLLRFTLNDKKAQRYLLGGVEQVIHKHEAELLSKSAHIIKSLYDEDVCEEDSLISWGEKPSSKYVSKSFAKKIIENSQPVLNWLKEAEEETEEESDDEIAFGGDVKESEFLRQQKEKAAREAQQKSAKATNGNAAAASGANDEEDLDIDDI
ncbi:Eukaryotic translation initiation factor 5 [Caenorhabditis elegans]|uniref:Eukaryotic translation initiation factor 5 n=1 Tax=Caenorhabditis elegans TaxID=6239 RepID=IF5_CAEEL|nr:Eukaryotic translation initiation factor 5 [Caenorhabditis elegans]Q22918.2 RecName: Full=Eukaryotic translation initiation factor 5; Short=eIF-5 [Caenorhabditis elegans]CCD66940.1 Eukaryotic translation initiation factor 5 [Caenorhabditis elegans]|eukprot:NP_741572.1 Eukaryotic translation initiation factor 5 [Caenorhabditis elegans]